MPPPQQSQRRLLKVVILGDSGVGKTSLLNRFINDKFSSQYKATIGADFMTKWLNVDGQEVVMQIWDTAGQERFQSLGVAFYRGADCCVLVYDLTLKRDISSLENWRNDFLMQTNPRDEETFPFLVLGNKSDADPTRIRVDPQMRERWSADHGMYHALVSAFTGSNVNEAFIELAKLALLRQTEDHIAHLGPDRIKFNSLQGDSRTPPRLPTTNNFRGCSC